MLQIKGPFLNDEVLLCKLLLSDTVSARRSPALQSTPADAAAAIVVIFMIAGSSGGGEEREVTRSYVARVGAENDPQMEA